MKQPNFYKIVKDQKCFRYCLAHNTGNERADDLAKKGAGLAA